MPRVLLCLLPYNRNPAWYLPLGALYIERALKEKNISVDLLDIDGLRLTKKEVIRHIQKDDYDIIGMSGLTTLFNYAKWLSGEIKKEKPEAKILLGGVLASSNYAYVLKNTDIDVCVLGDGEETVCELVNTIRGRLDLCQVKGIAFKNHDEQVVFTGKRQMLKNLDRYSITDYKSIKPSRYVRPGTLLASRGCASNCNFCYSATPGVRVRTPRSIYDEMKGLKENYKVNFFTFLDSYFMTNDAFVDDLSGRIKKLDVRWDCYGRLDKVKKDMLKKMKDSGCIRVSYGIESFDQRVLDLMNKNITVDKIKEGLDSTFSVGIKEICGSFIIGYFEQTIESAFINMREAEKWKLLAKCFYFTPFPGTVDYERAKTSGFISDEDDYIRNHIGRGDEFESISDKMYLNFSRMSNQELIDTHGLFNETFAFKQKIAGRVKSFIKKRLQVLKR